MLRILTSIAIAAVLAAAPLTLTAGTADAASKGTKICKHKTASGKIQKHMLRADGITADTFDREAAGLRLKRA